MRALLDGEGFECFATRREVKFDIRLEGEGIRDISDNPSRAYHDTFFSSCLNNYRSPGLNATTISSQPV